MTKFQEGLKRSSIHPIRMDEEIVAHQMIVNGAEGLSSFGPVPVYGMKIV